MAFTATEGCKLLIYSISKSGRDTAMPSPKSGRDTALPSPKSGRDTALPSPYSTGVYFFLILYWELSGDRICFCSHDKIIAVQSQNRVSPPRYRNFSPLG